MKRPSEWKEYLLVICAAIAFVGASAMFWIEVAKFYEGQL